MRWRVATAFFLISLIICIGIVSSLQTRQLCDDILHHLTAIRQSIELHGIDRSDALPQAQQLWQESLPFVCSIMIHDRVDDISRGFTHAAAFLELGTYDEYLASVNELILNFHILKEYDRPSIRSIL